MPIQIQIRFDPDTDPNGHQNDTVPYVDLTPCLTHVAKSEFIFTFSHSISTSLSRCHNFQHLEQHIEIFDKKVLTIFICLEINTGQDWPDWHARMPVPIRQNDADPIT
jgi:hypothetical protein